MVIPTGISANKNKGIEKHEYTKSKRIKPPQ